MKLFLLPILFLNPFLCHLLHLHLHRLTLLTSGCQLCCLHPLCPLLLLPLLLFLQLIHLLWLLMFLLLLLTKLFLLMSHLLFLLLLFLCPLYPLVLPQIHTLCLPNPRMVFSGLRPILFSLITPVLSPHLTLWHLSFLNGLKQWTQSSLVYNNTTLGLLFPFLLIRM